MFFVAGVAPLQAQYVEASKIDTLAKNLSEAQALGVLSAHLGVPSETLKKEMSETGLPIGQLFIAHEVAKVSKTDVQELFAENKTRPWSAIAKDKNVKMKDLDGDFEKVQKALKDLVKGK
jgi:hypothetical protein